MADSTPQPSVMQFSLRGLLVIVTSVAVVAGVLSPWIRSLEPAQQRRLIESFLFVTAGLLFGLMLSCVFRYRIEQCCGQRLVRLSHKYYSARRDVVGAVCVAFVLASQGIMVLIPREEPAGLFVLKRFNWFMHGALFAGVITWIWWRRTRFGAELCDHGIIVGLRFYGWKKFKCYHWNKDRDTLWLRTKWGAFKFDIPAKDYAEVNRIVQLNLGELISTPNFGQFFRSNSSAAARETPSQVSRGRGGG